MSPDESLQSLMNRVDQAIVTIQNLHPATFTIEQMDNELAFMAMIHALPQDYASFVSATLLLTDLDKEKIQSAFVTEEAQCHHRNASTQDSALITSTATKQSKMCTFCKYKGHMQETCC